MEATSSDPAGSASAAERAPRTEYTLFAVWRGTGATPTGVDNLAELDGVVRDLPARGVQVRGLYDVSALRADADLLIWIHAEDAAALQAAYRAIRRTAVVRSLEPVWNAMGVHRTAEFNARHVPAFLRGVEPKGWLCVYPFVRSYEWYLLPEDERSQMLIEHGRKGAVHRGVLTNTVASFALGDYEWLLPLEADDPMELVDLMRELRYTEARRHVREEIPFFTGRRVAVAELVDVLG